MFCHFGLQVAHCASYVGNRYELNSWRSILMVQIVLGDEELGVPKYMSREKLLKQKVFLLLAPQSPKMRRYLLGRPPHSQT